MNLSHFSLQNKKISELASLAESIQTKTKEYQQLANDEYKSVTGQLRERLEKGATEADILPDAYALVGAAATHILHMTPYKVQIMGATVLNDNMIAEMHTGEGKTLTATMPLYLNAISGKGAHLVTANAYLAKRDAEELKPLYNALGMSIGFTDENEKDRSKKQAAYKCDILYTTGPAVGFDYLNDNLVETPEERRQRGFNYVLIDEADSVLLDNARTPLIISGKSRNFSADYQRADVFVRHLKDDEVIVEKEQQSVRLKPSGVYRARQMYGDDLFINQRANVHYIMNALQAHYLFENGVDYITKDSKEEGVKAVELIDANTGRVLDGNHFSEGIHQALEAKENAMIHKQNQTSASITYQSLFSMYTKVAGMTGTAMTDRDELEAVYGLSVLPIPTNKPDRRKDLPDRVFSNMQAKFKAVAEAIVKYNRKGQPVLVGTNSVLSSQMLHDQLDNYGIDHEVLNALNPEYEAKIVANAGKKGAVTIATNMAGRGTDIKISKEIASMGGLVVIGTERQSSPRVDNQLRGRAARQGQPGVTQIYMSLEDDIFKKIKPTGLEYYREKYAGRSDEISSPRLIHLFDVAQKEIAQQNYDSRKSDLTYENVIAHEREAIYHERRKIVDLNYDPLKVLQKVNSDVITNYFDRVQLNGQHALNQHRRLQKVFRRVANAGVSREATRKIQRELVDPSIGERIKLGRQYDSLDAVKQFLINGYNHEAESYQKLAGDNFRIMVSKLFQVVIDEKWSKEIGFLNDLKQMITLEGYRQANPYVEYQRQASAAYKEMLLQIEKEVFNRFYRMKIHIVEVEDGSEENGIS